MEENPEEGRKKGGVKIEKQEDGMKKTVEVRSLSPPARHFDPARRRFLYLCLGRTDLDDNTSMPKHTHNCVFPMYNNERVYQLNIENGWI